MPEAAISTDIIIVVPRSTRHRTRPGPSPMLPPVAPMTTACMAWGESRYLRARRATCLLPSLPQPRPWRALASRDLRLLATLTVFAVTCWSGTPPQAFADDPVPPMHQKILTQQPDGTYDVTLSVKGAVDSSVTTQYADVLL